MYFSRLAAGWFKPFPENSEDCLCAKPGYFTLKPSGPVIINFRKQVSAEPGAAGLLLSPGPRG